jgi:hypothetical protein
MLIAAVAAAAIFLTYQNLSSDLLANPPIEGSSNTNRQKGQENHRQITATVDSTVKNPVSRSIETSNSKSLAAKFSSSVTDEFQAQNDMKVLFDRLIQSTVSWDRFKAALILENCAFFRKNHAYTRAWPTHVTGPNFELRQRLLEQLRLRHPAELCKNFSDAELGDSNVESVYRLAATEGNSHPLASLWLADLDIRQRAEPARTKTGADPRLLIATSLDSETFNAAREALFANSVDGILFAGPILTHFYKNHFVLLGGDSLSIKETDFLWQSVACSLSNRCGIEEMRELKIACVTERACDVTDYDSYIRTYHFRSEADWLKFVQVRDGITQAIGSGNRNYFQLGNRAEVNRPFSGTGIIAGSRPRLKL